MRGRKWKKDKKRLLFTSATISWKKIQLSNNLVYLESKCSSILKHETRKARNDFTLFTPLGIFYTQKHPSHIFSHFSMLQKAEECESTMPRFLVDLLQFLDESWKPLTLRTCHHETYHIVPEISGPFEVVCVHCHEIVPSSNWSKVIMVCPTSKCHKTTHEFLKASHYLLPT